MRSKIRTTFPRLLAPLVVLMAATLPFATAAQAAPSATLYDDSLHWDSWSWNTSVDPDSTSEVYTGSTSMAVTYNEGWSGLQLTSDGFDVGADAKLEFAIHPNGEDLPRIYASMYDSNDPIKQVNIESYVGESSDGWYPVSIPAEDLGADGKTIYRVQLQNASWSSVPTIYIDDLAVIETDSDSESTSSESTSNEAASSSGSYPTGSFRPDEASKEVDDAIREAVAKYNLPRWFYYAQVKRETYHFNPNATHGRDKGLTQLSSPARIGRPYPEWLNEPNNHHKQYGYDLNFSKYGMWIKMEDVSRLTDPFDPQQNLDRYSSGYAVPAFKLFKRLYGESDEETLRRVAFHWNKSIHTSYDRDNYDYLHNYDKYVDRFKPIVEEQDGKWDGNPRLP